jgi:hypothetical protein
MIFTLILIVSLFPYLISAKDVYVKGFYRSDGTYVRPHYSLPQTAINGITMAPQETLSNY